MFYVYEHIRNDTNAIFYVGKGKGNRAYRINNRNEHWHNIVNKAQGFTVRFVAKDLDEELAYLCEEERIDQLEKLGIKLSNICPGGKGVGSGKKHPMYGKSHPQKGIKRPEVAIKVSGKNNGMWGKISPMRGIPKPKGKDSPLYGRPRPEGGGKPSKGVIAIDKDGNKFTFVSLAEAGRFVKSDRHSIKKWCEMNKHSKGFTWKFLDNKGLA
jgi:hypothetical protein